MSKLLRYKPTKYMKLAEKGFSDFWTHKVADYKQDKQGFESKFDDIARDIFLKTIGYQSLMDNDVSNGYSVVAKMMDTDDKKILYSWISFNEVQHSLSYAYGLEQVFGHQAEEILDELEKNPIIQKRMEVEEESENKLINKPTFDNMLTHIINTYLLEAIKFPLSFFVVFKLNDEYNGAINGFSRALKEIANDELNVHIPTNMNFLLDYMRKDSIQSDIITKKVIKRIEQIIKEEEEWADFLFEKGEPKGLSKKLYKYLVEYFTDKALIRLGLTPLFNVEKTLDITWFDNYRNITKEVVSEQETQSVSYQMDIIDDVDRLSELKG